MKQLVILAVALLLSTGARGDGITVQKIAGDVRVRQGVTEVWNTVTTGDALRPHDTIRTGPDGTAVLVVHVEASGATKRVALPARVIVDMSDIRDLSQEDLMLKLAMEKVRASSDQWKNDGLHLPNAAVVHGEDRAAGPPAKENDGQVGQLLLNGVRVLFDNGFYATTVLRVLEVFRMYPAFSAHFDNRLLLAQAMERANLKGEALAEYGAMSHLEGLTLSQSRLVDARLEALRADRR
jgi:hypothetical protein